MFSYFLLGFRHYLGTKKPAFDWQRLGISKAFWQKIIFAMRKQVDVSLDYTIFLSPFCHRDTT